MEVKKYAAQIDNVFFLGRIGHTLRLATSDIAREELPQNIQVLLRRLDRREQRKASKQALTSR